MKILFLSVEVSPFAKVGGLADVAGSLPKALLELGHDVRIVMPAYRMVEENPQYNVTGAIDSFRIDLNPNVSKNAYLKKTSLGKVPVYLLGTDEWFSDAVDSSTVYRLGIEQYLFFACGALKAVEDLGWIPDVVHCNDWHTGFVPVAMREKYSDVWDKVASVMTIHNLAYQGEFGPDVLDKMGLPVELFNHHQVEAHGRVNFLKSGCSYSDRVNTVSVNYAREVQTAQFGAGLDGLMRHLAHEGRFEGILNGLDVETFDPATDPDQAAPFCAGQLDGKAICRTALLKRLKLKPIDGAPILGVVSRLSHQKGIDLLIDCAPRLFELPIQLVVQGIGDSNLSQGLKELQRVHPEHVRFVEEFDPKIAQMIYGGSDGFLMPSLFEPCGLGQMIAMRYGTVPIVRQTGGLADTMFEGKNGFVFQESSADRLVDAVGRAVSAYGKPERWRKLVLTGMKADFSWKKSARAYVALYEAACASRKTGRKSA